MIKSRLLFGMAILGSLLTIPAHGQPIAGDFLVVVNEANNLNTDDENIVPILKRLYLKDLSSWPNGDDAVFFARPAGSPEEQAFRAKILEMDDDPLEEHWTRMKQVKGETPPRAVSSTRILIRQLGMKEHAVGIVSKEEFETLATDENNLKILTSFSGN